MFVNIIRLRKVSKYSNSALEKRQGSQGFEDQIFEGPLERVVKQKEKSAFFNLFHSHQYHFDNIFEIGLA